MLNCDLFPTGTCLSGSTHSEWGTYNHTTRFKWMELGPDDKIYVNEAGVSLWKHVIEKPDLAGANCQFTSLRLSAPKSFNPCVPHFPNFKLGSLLGVNDVMIDGSKMISIAPNLLTSVSVLQF